MCRFFPEKKPKSKVARGNIEGWELLNAGGKIKCVDMTVF